MEEKLIFTQDYYSASNFVTNYTCQKVYEILSKLKSINNGQESFSLSEVLEELSCTSEFTPSVVWALDFLVQQGILSKDKDNYIETGMYYEIRNEESFSTEIAISIKLIDYVADNWINVINGTISPVRLFFGTTGGQLWMDYFSNENGLYSVHNRWLVDNLKNIISRNDQILELGAGFGSATELVTSLYESNGIDNYSYYASDLSNLMLNKIRKKLGSDKVNTLVIDFDKNIEDQCTQLKFDLIIGINALHCAKNLESTLISVKNKLTSGGSLILSESTRGKKGELLHQEFIFNLLPGYKMEIGSNYYLKGFMTLEDWEIKLKNAGFDSVEILSNSKHQVLASIITGRLL